MLLGGNADHILASSLLSGVGRSELLTADNHEGLLSVQVPFWIQWLCIFKRCTDNSISYLYWPIKNFRIGIG